MIFDKILSFLFGVKKSTFEITKQELEKISCKDQVKEDTIDLDTTVVFKDSFSALSETIFEEATQKFKINRYNY
ncbi:hypothetical protein ACWGOQ_0015840 [Aquimarina sp. M1]